MNAKKSVHGSFKANALKAIWLLLIFSQRKLQMKLLCFLIYLWKGRPSTVPSVATDQRRKITQNCKFLLLKKRKNLLQRRDSIIQQSKGFQKTDRQFETCFSIQYKQLKNLLKRISTFQRKHQLHHCLIIDFQKNKTENSFRLQTASQITQNEQK